MSTPPNPFDDDFSINQSQLSADEKRMYFLRGLALRMPRACGKTECFLEYIDLRLANMMSYRPASNFKIIVVTKVRAHIEHSLNDMYSGTGIEWKKHITILSLAHMGNADVTRGYTVADILIDPECFII